MSDPTKSWLALRRTILIPPFEPVDISPHITLVHPRTSRHGAEAWSELHDLEDARQLVVREFCLTSTNLEDGMSIRRTFGLTGATRQLCAAVILVDGDRGLLALRAAHREWYPGVWDLIGGRVEATETLSEAACREAHEELGVLVSLLDLLHVDTLVTDDAEVVVFAASKWDGIADNVAPAEHSEIRWVDITALNALETAHPRLGDLVSTACSRVDAEAQQ